MAKAPDSRKPRQALFSARIRQTLTEPKPPKSTDSEKSIWYNGRVKLTNYTKVPSELLRDMIRLATPPGVSGYDISFKNAGDGFLHGRAYTQGTSYHQRNGKCPPLVVIQVPKWYGPKDTAYRKQYSIEPGHGNPRRALGRNRQSCRGYMPGECWTDHERLVEIIAHELRHLWQRRVKRGRRVWGARGQFSERDADAYAIRMTRAWRRR